MLLRPGLLRASHAGAGRDSPGPAAGRSWSTGAMTARVHRKARADAPPGFFACEAAGLRWLAAARAVPVVRVLEVRDDALLLEHLEAAPPTPDAARELGRGLARLHDRGAPAFGCPPDGWTGDGFFGPLDAPLPLRSGAYERWGPALADLRLEPVREPLRATGRLSPGLAAALDVVGRRLRDGAWDDGDGPARVHGDLWSGNVVWTAAGAVLIDPAAHGGHRVSDLAMLALFGLPHLDVVLAGYQEQHPLPTGWRDLLGLHQLFPVAVHAVLFGGGYVGQLERLATHYAGG
ncbi:fructosamine kinase family protein [Actinotalea sp. JY-7885]|uniref:fructosamine kinase family protein n=1 Tax=Actinotalea sp. JY-7885 TaxID=2758576 RepID=UPI0028166100|nr:fructosamine kinase family protein [Actinotalea sp. JY-7885]